MFKMNSIDKNIVVQNVSVITESNIYLIKDLKMNDWIMEEKQPK